MIVSDQPLVRDREMLRGVLRDYAIDGKRLFPDGKTFSHIVYLDN